MGSPTGLDKRRFRRLDATLDVTVRIDTDEKKTGLPESLQAACRNLSLEGLCLETSRLAHGAVKLLSGRRGERDYRLSLEIVLNAQDPPLQARGEVCWYNVDHSAVDFIYQIGVEFVELAPQSRAALKRFIRKHCRPRSPLQLIKSFFFCR